MSKLTKTEKDLKIKDLKIVASKKGGKFLSRKYLGARIPHKWQCKEGHIWKATPDNVKRGQWCPIDAGKMDPKFALKYLRRDDLCSLSERAAKVTGIPLADEVEEKAMRDILG